MESAKQNKSRMLFIALTLQLMLYLIQELAVNAVYLAFEKSLTAYLAASVISVPFVFLLPLYLYCKLTGYRPFRNDFKKNESSHPQAEFSVKNIWHFIFAAAAVISAVNLLGMLTDTVISLFGKLSAQNLPQGAVPLTLTFIKTVLFAPILEEMLFRGAVIHAFSDRSDKFKILISATLFALMHYDLAALPYAFGAGLVISYFAVTKRSIKYGIALHFVSNLTTFIFSLLTVTIDPALYSTISAITFWILLAVALVGGALLLISSRRSEAECPAGFAEPFPRELILYIAFAAVMSVLNF